MFTDRKSVASNIRSATTALESGAWAVLSWADSYPVEAGLAGLDFPCMELRTHLAGDVCRKVREGLRLSGEELGCLSEMEGALAKGYARMDAWASAQDAQESDSMAGMITLGTAVLGFIGAVF